MAEHVIAKDILKPHAIFWPTMLKSMGVEPYQRLHVHGYWKVDDTKMSKSIGNVVKPLDLISEYGVDTLRYFLLREMSFGLDASFSSDAIVARQNADLANDLGNLFSRSLAMVKKFTNNQIPAPPAELLEIDEKLKHRANKMIGSYKRNMDGFAFNKALQNIWEVISHANKYIVANAPWELAKDQDKKPRLDAVIYNLLEVLRMIALPLHAVMPETAATMFKVLGVNDEVNLDTMGEWGEHLKSGTEIASIKALFPRMDKKKSDGSKKSQNKPAKQSSKQQTNKKGADKDQKGEEGESAISFDDFSRLDLRVATIVAAEKIKKSDRLLKLTVQAPEDRTIVAGIAEYYQPEQVIGKQVIIVANLKPVKLMGVVSHGMVMAAKKDGRLVLSTVSDEIAAGSKVS